MAQYIDSFPGREITIAGKKHLYFGGTAYMGLQTDDGFKELFVKNIRKYGTNYGASRKSNIRMSIFGKAEQHLAGLVGAEACATLSSGYLAAQFTAQALNIKTHRFFYAPNTHPALYPAPTKSYTTFTALNIAVREHLSSQPNKTPVIFLDSIDFSGCNFPDFIPLQILPLDKLILVVDDSHGIGIVGEDGGGVYRMLSELPIKELLVCASLGKGFGIQAGGVFGSTERISYMTETPFFGGASPPAPAALATLLEAETIFSEKREKLQSNIALFLDALANPQKLSYMKHHPAFSFSDVQLMEYLEQSDIVLTSFPYPDEDSQLMSRIVLSAQHLEKDILRLAELLNEQRA
ncbi:pyridoxal phosphate-dependent aminotransferase family protein [Pricia sp. S334]|uniref:Pyridoxal phosphate-dependent aminotransferase family protein n=1 Tax=Pricia mediterranea TaxID=3076079 RepID=A0ABU3L037_9FLAO|nr:pyridoxal phosphate-dependent aminotransferase family protein [Pricia sp. S334]MDT7827092.1 pyridoxal phosphate-dependent aminotransferase family protein [Pricia sp. S334]